MSASSHELQSYIEHFELLSDLQARQATASSSVQNVLQPSIDLALLTLEELEPSVHDDFVNHALGPDVAFSEEEKIRRISIAYTMSHALINLVNTLGATPEHKQVKYDTEELEDVITVAKMLLTSRHITLEKDEEDLIENCFEFGKNHTAIESTEVLGYEVRQRSSAVTQTLARLKTTERAQTDESDGVQAFYCWLDVKAADPDFLMNLDKATKDITLFEVDRPKKVGGAITVQVYKGTSEEVMKKLKHDGVATITVEDEPYDELLAIPEVVTPPESPTKDVAAGSKKPRRMKNIFAKVELENGEVVYNKDAIMLSYLFSGTAEEPLLLEELARVRYPEKTNDPNMKKQKLGETRGAIEQLRKNLSLPNDTVIEQRELIDGSVGYWIGSPVSDEEKSQMRNRDANEFVLPNGVPLRRERAHIMRVLHLAARREDSKPNHKLLAKEVFGERHDRMRLLGKAVEHMSKADYLPEGWSIRYQMNRHREVVQARLRLDMSQPKQHRS